MSESDQTVAVMTYVKPDKLRLMEFYPGGGSPFYVVEFERDKFGTVAAGELAKVLFPK
jgi:predicted AlkP superfamily phosphohydrolase/phosphomutase